MTGSEAQLKDGEKVLLRRNPHWTTLREGFSVLFVSFLALLVFAALLPMFIWAGVIICLLALAVLAANAVVWRHTYFILTTDRLIHHSGVFTTEETEIPLDRIFNVEYWQTPLQRLLRIGDVRLETVGDHGQIRLHDVLHPVETQNRIYCQVQICSLKGPAVLIDGAGRDLSLPPLGATRLRTKATADQICEQITKLHQLHQSGVLTRDEFEGKKRELLDRI